MFDGAYRPAEPDWKAVAQLVMHQRDRAEQKASNFELDIALAGQRETALQKRIAELEAHVVDLILRKE